MPGRSIKYEPDTDIKIYEARRQTYINCGYAPVDTKTLTGKTCQLSKKDQNCPVIHLTFLEGRLSS